MLPCALVEVASVLADQAPVLLEMPRTLRVRGRNTQQAPSMALPQFATATERFGQLLGSVMREVCLRATHPTRID